MADSLGIKDAAKESSKGLNYDDKEYVHGALGVDPYACLEANLAGFKPMRDNHEKFTCEEVVLWLRRDSEQEKQMKQSVLVRGKIRTAVRRGRRHESRQVLAPRGEEILAGSHERGGWV